MMGRGRLFGLFVAGAALVAPNLAFAQTQMESVGSRAQGMAGAFVAVADDATAPYWNPAGPATAGPAGAVFDWTKFQESNRRSFFGSVGAWPLGFSVQDQAAVVGGERFETRQYGLNLLQTIVEGLVVGANLKWVRGGVAPDGTDVSHSNAFDLDAGVMVDMQRVRVGLTAKNLRQASFERTSGSDVSLARQIRAGLAILPRDGVTLAVDLDLDTADLWDGPRRVLAMGGETRLTGRLMGRAGVRWNFEDDDRRPAYSAGGSVRLSTSTWLDAHVTYRADTRERAFGAALRAGF
jgi:hypothetical protein